MTRSATVRFAAALATTLLGVVAGAALPTAAASADTGYCAKGSGANVVVDYGPLGGGVQVGCDPDGAGVAASTVVPRAGFSLTYVSGQPFVCRIDGKPDASQEGCGHTPPADAYWGLFWSDGKSGSWNYSTTGVTGLKVPAGGFIGWRFEDGGGRDNPGLAPVAPGPTATPKPSAEPSPKPSTKPSAKPSAESPRPDPTQTTGGPSPTSGESSATASAIPSGGDSGSAGAKPTERSPDGAASGAPASAASASALAAPAQAGVVQEGEGASEGGSAELTYLAAGSMLLLGAAAGVIGWRRRS